MDVRALLMAALVGILGCSSDGSSGPGPNPGDPDAGDTTNPDDPDAGASGGFADLITGDWSMPPGQEGYVCVYKTIERTVYAKAFRPKIPTGTHHTVLTVGPKQREDGVVGCNAGTNYGAQVFGSGVGTNALELPEGVAVKLEAGDQLLLNLHLFNFSDSELIGNSGTEFVEVDEASVEHVAEAFMVSKFDLNIPKGESMQQGDCTVTQNATLISVAPHMHMLGTYMRVVAQRPGRDSVTLLDEPYLFDEQIVKLLPEPVEVQAGDKIHIECSYNNTTDGTVRFGDSSLQEMCISGHFRYPATGTGLFCAAGF